MPLIKYFGFVGSALVILLLGVSWCFPQPVPDPIPSSMGRPVIRISSVEKLPDRVDIDTSLPTIVPPPSVMEFAERQPVGKLAEAYVDPKPTSQAAGHDPLKKQRHTKRDRPVPATKNETASNYRERPITQATRLSLLDAIKERLGNGLFRTN